MTLEIRYTPAEERAAAIVASFVKALCKDSDCRISIQKTATEPTETA